MPKNIALLLATSMLTFGCVNADAISNLVVEDALYSPPINGITAGCSSMGVKKDCDNISGANKKITINGVRMRVAGSSDGRRILVMYSSDRCGFGDSSCQTRASNSAYYVVKNRLTRNGVSIEKVTPVAVSDFINGYLIQVDADGYSLID
ncbi:hypothetical protein MHM98_00795 [Psychrobium sp. MM17-31]|uniref:hypothetical protein n=1 Tax=Psychrobium sp. MM17-31 TaxID=2917758 RepID=UPI001EF6B23D|nr:hypothetical protein [Psychrobium sp. MM17-31]MCG7529899.1 hypothetical protein [Psychrobium sp. MM17-31]